LHIHIGQLLAFLEAFTVYMRVISLYMCDSDQPLVAQLLDRIREEAALWAKVGAAGLRVIIPSTWDVH
jgi:hypothetical protein